jgi:SAM-dependent methyltransferase
MNPNVVSNSAEDTQSPAFAVNGAPPVSIETFATEQAYATWLYASTIFLSAFLLFQVQPILGKTILPWFGGSAAVWSTCLMFFQVLLVLGYAYATWSSRHLTPKQQTLVHVSLLGVSILLLPVAPNPNWKPSGAADPTFRILGLLAVTVGLPYFLLSATSPMLQVWYARGRPRGTPYRLFALSNAGSMLALLAYPVLVEPILGTRAQSLTWSAAYVGFVLLCGGTAFWQRAHDHRQAIERLPQATDEIPRADWFSRLLWLLLPAAASVLLLGITSHLTQDVAPAPFLWLFPFVLYLLSFVLCFESDRWYSRAVWLPLLVAALGGLAYALYGEYTDPGLRVTIPLLGTAFFVCCMFCHGELARLKPHPRHLTSFYLMCSAGGAAGGVFVGLLAPRLFMTTLELPLALLLCAALALAVVHRDPAGWLYRARLHPAWLALVLIAAGLFVYVGRGIRSARNDSGPALRNFYGELRVQDDETDDGVPLRRLMHGVITHGTQLLAPDRRREPTTYFRPDSGVGLVFSRGEGSPRRLAVVGLGAGTLAAYGRKGDRYRFYEINPSVIQLANTEFSFVRDSPASIEVVPGDARLSLEHEGPQQLDALAVDAFSGDSIPVHLLTKEALELYFRHLVPDGVLAVHVSNRYLDLVPVLEQAAHALGKQAVLVDTNDENNGVGFGATWVLLARPGGVLNEPAFQDASTEFPAPTHAPRLWTDDYSNLWQVVK